MRYFIRTGREIGKRLMSTSERTSATMTATANHLWGKYNHQLNVNPVITKSLTAGAIAFSADIICQLFFPTTVKKIKKPMKDRINWQRTANFTLINLVFVPPMVHYWYGFLSTRILGAGVVPTLKRVALDQFIFAPLFIPAFLFASFFLEGKLDQLPNKLRADWFSTVIMNYKVWIPAQLVNFSVVPPQLRVLWGNFIGFFWNIYFSGSINKEIEEKIEAGEIPLTPEKKN